MRVIFKPGMLVVSPENEAERRAFSLWRDQARGHVLYFDGGTDKGGALHDLGLREDACREPIDIASNQADARWRLVGNLAETPFILHARRYASVEGFWQSLKVESEADRDRVGGLWGQAARTALRDSPSPPNIVYGGQSYATGGPGHRRLMLLACRAKFDQHADARAALLSTGERPLIHRLRRDPQDIPGALMADIWMRIRGELRGAPREEQDWTGDQPDGRILFFARDRAAFGFMSHFEPSPIEMDGVIWPTVEHYFQAQRSLDPEYVAAIRSARTPGAAKQLAADPDPSRVAAQKSWFSRMKRAPRSDWADVRLDVMRRADLAKYMQNPALAKRLLATGDAELVEDSPFDDFWGAGHRGDGRNWAGRILMEVRRQLAAT